MQTCTPRRHPLAIACTQAHGFSLLEVSLALAVAAAFGTAAFLAFKPSSTVAAVRVEQGNLRDLSQAIETSFGLVGTFNGVTTARVSEDGLVPSTLLRSGSLRTSWGGAVEVAAAEVTQPNDAFAIAYQSVPSDACVGLAGAVAESIYDLKIGGHSVFTAGSLDPAVLASRCSSDGAANMVFIYHSGLASGSAVASTPVSNPPPVVAPPTAPPVPPGAPVAPPTAPPVTVTPPLIVAPPTVTPPPVAPPVAPPPGTPGVTPPTSPPIGPPAVAPPYGATCEQQKATPQSRTGDCVAGQFGMTTEGRAQDCPGNEAWQAPVWLPWTASGNTCAACPGPFNETNTRWETRGISCPNGFSGTWTREYAQAQTRTGSTSCPTGTRTLPAPTLGAWSAWTDTGATRNDNNGCAAATGTWTNVYFWVSTTGEMGWPGVCSSQGIAITNVLLPTAYLPAPFSVSWSGVAAQDFTNGAGIRYHNQAWPAGPRTSYSCDVQDYPRTSPCAPLGAQVRIRGDVNGNAQDAIYECQAP